MTAERLESAIEFHAQLQGAGWLVRLAADGDLHVQVGDEVDGLPQPEIWRLLHALAPELAVLLADVSMVH
jgi:hypothetical protein